MATKRTPAPAPAPPPAMDLRDYYALVALQQTIGQALSVAEMQHLSTYCYRMADAMLAARSN